ncbi:MAG: DUF6089 family protein [Saprospiraceae bacterium]|nr:DUF6089 family protein [Saprospiraceae bacterium]
MKVFPPILIAMFFSVTLLAQPAWEAGVFVGASNYTGDFTVATTPRIDKTNIALGLVGRSHINSNFALRINLTITQMEGQDSDFARRATRGYSFVTNYFELVPAIEWEPFGGKRFYTDAEGIQSSENIISPYLYLGGGLSFSEVDIDFNGDNSADVFRDSRNGSTNTFFTIPFGGGLKFDFIEQVALGAELTARYTFSDYIDGLSEAGNPSNNDWIWLLGFNISYRFY